VLFGENHDLANRTRINTTTLPEKFLSLWVVCVSIPHHMGYDFTRVAPYVDHGKREFHPRTMYDGSRTVNRVYRVVNLLGRAEPCLEVVKKSIQPRVMCRRLYWLECLLLRNRLSV
jgi:hypothetical protein